MYINSNLIELKAISDLIEVDNEELIHDNSLLGAKYIKFIMSNKYLCINRRLQLFGSVNKNKHFFGLCISTSFKALFPSMSLSRTRKQSLKILSIYDIVIFNCIKMLNILFSIEYKE